VSAPVPTKLDLRQHERKDRHDQVPADRGERCDDGEGEAQRE
jgi:hypothetical protein